jgi:hypothetical protein
MFPVSLSCSNTHVRNYFWNKVFLYNVFNILSYEDTLHSYLPTRYMYENLCGVGYVWMT